MIQTSTKETWRTAAVLVVFCMREEGPKLVLIRRGGSGVYGGQIALPGGKAEPVDSSPLATALRETEEEIGIGADSIEVIEPLPLIHTRTTGFRIHPYLVKVEPPESWHPQEGEIEEVIEIDLQSVLDPKAYGEELLDFPTWPEPRVTKFIRLGADRIWGVTYRILEPLLFRFSTGKIHL